MATGKSTGKSKGLPAHLKPGNPGHSGGKKGRSGRKPLPFVQACERLADTAVLAKVETYLERGDPSDPAWRWCAEYVSRYTKTELKRMEVANADAAPFVVRIVREAAA